MWSRDTRSPNSRYQAVPCLLSSCRGGKYTAAVPLRRMIITRITCFQAMLDLYTPLRVYPMIKGCGQSSRGRLIIPRRDSTGVLMEMAHLA